MDILKLENVSLTYQSPDGEVKAVEDLSFSCPEKSFLSIIGPSGCGKTTILSLISGLLKPTNGRIEIYGNERKKNDLGYMLQKDHLFSWRTVLKNVYLPLEIQKNKVKENKSYALSLLEKYGLKDFINKHPSELSGGMKQRVALIRTLVSKPPLLLLDEPFSALDCQTRLSVADDVYNIIKAEEKTAVLVTHDISEAISMSDIIVTLTARPAKVKSIFVPNLKGNSPREKREDEKFGIWFEKIRKELNI